MDKLFGWWNPLHVDPKTRPKSQPLQPRDYKHLMPYLKITPTEAAQAAQDSWAAETATSKPR